MSYYHVWYIKNLVLPSIPVSVCVMSFHPHLASQIIQDRLRKLLSRFGVRYSTLNSNEDVCLPTIYRVVLIFISHCCHPIFSR